MPARYPNVAIYLSELKLGYDRFLEKNRFILIPLFVSASLISGCNQSSQEVSKAPNISSNPPQQLSFQDFYKMPVGPRGLEPSGKLLSLNQQRVRIAGYMVHEEEPTAGLFLLTPVPVNIPEKEDGPSDDLHGSTLFVHLPPKDTDKILVFRAGLWELAGRLELGAKEEANGRVSYTRLYLDEFVSPNIGGTD